jgi:hypothetical protein
MSVTGGSNAESATATARYNRIYTVGVGNSVSPDNLGFTEAAGSEDEGTVIVDPRGTVLAKTANHHEDTATARIPIADFRKTRRVRKLPIAVAPVLDSHEPVFQPNAFSRRCPRLTKEAGAAAESMQGS